MTSVRIVINLLIIVNFTFTDYPVFGISHGNNASDDQFPWHATISFLDINQTKHYCGGSILTDEWILTTAHCISPHREVSISFGTLNLTDPQKIMKSKRFHIFPSYDSHSWFYDIGLIQLPKKLVFTNFIRPIALPSLSKHDEINIENYENRTAFLSGFGHNIPMGNVSSILQWTELQIISNSQCARSYKNDTIRPSILCTVGLTKSDQGPCPGDSGGALVLNENGTWIQVGVMAFITPGSCASSIPAGYMRITFLQDWISEIVNFNLD